MLSEAIFFLIIVGCLVAVGATFWLQRPSAASRRLAREDKTKIVAHLARVDEDARKAASAAAGGPSGTRIGGLTGEGSIVAREALDPALASKMLKPDGSRAATAPSASAAAPRQAPETSAGGAPSQPVEEGTSEAPRHADGAPPGRVPDQPLEPVTPGVPSHAVSTVGLVAASKPKPEVLISSTSGGGPSSVFVSSKRGLPISEKQEDVWAGWEDVNVRNIGGTQGTGALSEAFDLAAGSRARRLLEDLTRKGVEVTFGKPEEFEEEHAEEIATFDFSRYERPGSGAPETRPSIRFNPKFMHEAPEVLAAALVHEATHFQQFLDGSLFEDELDHVELELAAWSNEAAFWDEVRGGLGQPDSVLETQTEFAYRTALRGEAALRDLLEALHG